MFAVSWILYWRFEKHFDNYHSCHHYNNTWKLDYRSEKCISISAIKPTKFWKMQRLLLLFIFVSKRHSRIIRSTYWGLFFLNIRGWHPKFKVNSLFILSPRLMGELRAFSLLLLVFIADIAHESKHW